MIGAPVSKFLSILMLLSYVAAEVLDCHQQLSLDADALLNEGEVWRIFTSQIVFGSMGELLFGMGTLCPLMCRFEREMGSRKYGTFLLTTSLLSLIWEMSMSQIILTAPRAGPYHFLGSHLFLFHRYGPRLFPRFFGLFGFDFSEKCFTYAFAFQLILANGQGELLASVLGAVAGYACSTPALPLHRLELPEGCYAIWGIFGLGGAPPRVVRRRRVEAVGTRQRLIPSFGEGEAARPVAEVAVPEELVENLTGMGFGREEVVRTLRACNNNVELAANRLLSE